MASLYSRQLHGCAAMTVGAPAVRAAFRRSARVGHAAGVLVALALRDNRTALDAAVAVQDVPAARLNAVLRELKEIYSSMTPGQFCEK